MGNWGERREERGWKKSGGDRWSLEEREGKRSGGDDDGWKITGEERRKEKEASTEGIREGWRGKHRRQNERKVKVGESREGRKGREK